MCPGADVDDSCGGVYCLLRIKRSCVVPRTVRRTDFVPIFAHCYTAADDVFLPKLGAKCVAIIIEIFDFRQSSVVIVHIARGVVQSQDLFFIV